MNIIPHVRLLMKLVAGGILFYLFSSILEGLLPEMATGNVYFMIMKAGFGFFIILILFVSIAKYFIEVRIE